MPTARPFAYNTGNTISGTEQLGDLAIGVDPLDYSEQPGGVQWWSGPDEDLGYVITLPVPNGSQPNDLGIPAYVGFEMSELKTEQSFVDLVNQLFVQSFTTGNECKTYLNNNGYWTSWISVSPTPTPTPTITPTVTITPTSTVTPTVTPTPSSTPSSGGAVIFSQTFTGGQSPGVAIETAWTTFRSQLTGTYTKFDFTSSNGQGYTTITDNVKVQQLADALRTGTTGVNFSTNISGVTWNVGCCNCRAGGAANGAVEFANVALCSGSSTAALRPWINNSNWGGIGTTVNAATQTLTLKFY
jgi:hypothetical protein